MILSGWTAATDSRAFDEVARATLNNFSSKFPDELRLKTDIRKLDCRKSDAAEMWSLREELFTLMKEVRIPKIRIFGHPLDYVNAER